MVSTVARFHYLDQVFKNVQ